MCGIVAAASQDNVVNILADGLKHLEYRGYGDSAGIAVIENKTYIVIKKRGMFLNLLALDKDLVSNIGIAHTRWVTL